MVWKIYTEPKNGVAVVRTVDKLPNLEQFETTITRHTMLHEQMQYFYRGFRRDAHPMAIIVGGGGGSMRCSLCMTEVDTLVLATCVSCIEYFDNRISTGLNIFV